MEELGTVFIGIFIIVFGLVWMVLWTLVPFFIYGINKKLTELIRILKRIEALKK